MFFMRFAIDAIFLDHDLVVVGIAHDLAPGRPPAVAAQRRSSSSQAVSATVAASNPATRCALA